jgi:hypothetical protein
MTPLVLLRPHTHAGKAHSPGDTLTVSPITADWLIAQGIAQRDASAARSLLERDYEDVGADAVASTASTKTTHRIKEPKA